jgi:ABC-2 type transport system permease protein
LACGRDHADLAVGVTLTGLSFGQLVLAVLGVLVVSAEFATGSVLPSLTAVPWRTRLLIAETVVTAWAELLTAALALSC